MSEQPQEKRSLRQKIGGMIAGQKPERIEQGWNRLHIVGGMAPIFNIDDLEQRRQEIKGILEGIKDKTLTAQLQQEVVYKTFAMFFLSGDPWVRGLGNRELSQKVADFLALYIDIGPLPAFLPDMFMCAMQLLSLSFQEIDVTNTPPYIIESRQAMPAEDRIDLSGSNAGSRTKTEEV